MKPHQWSRRMAVYEGIDMVVCKGCGAVVLVVVESLDESCEMAKLPLDCDEAVPIVIHEEYDDWTGGPWDDDEKPRWD